MSGRKVDVVAVMDAAIAYITERHPLGGIDPAPLRAARTAVAELLAADGEYDEANRVEYGHSGNINWRRWNNAQKRRVAALARVRP